MKLGLITLLILSQISAAGADPAAPPAPFCSPAPHAWLGLKVDKPDETVIAHVPSLPPGIGFLVRSIDAGGPAEAAGLRELDLLWKLGDQMLVNEAQLATLLRLKQPGERIALSGFRGGQPLEVKLILGEAPISHPHFTGEMIESAIMPSTCDGPMRVVNFSDRTATFSDEEGKILVWRENGGFRVKIRNLKDEVIYEGTVIKECGTEGVPESWYRKVLVLCRTLDQTLTRNLNSERQPKLRVVPAPPQNP